MKENIFFRKTEDKSNNKEVVLSKIRKSKHLSTFIRSVFLFSFLNQAGFVDAENSRVSKQKENKEFSEKTKIQNPTPESYDIRENKNLYLSLENNKSKDPESLIKDGILNSEKEFLDFFIKYASERQLNLKEEIKSLKEKLLQGSNDSIANLIDDKEISLKKWISAKEEKEKDKIKLLSNLEDSKYEMTDKDFKILENSNEIVKTFNLAKDTLVDIMSSPDYLKKLKKEFNCSLEEAKKHQETRINNIKMTDCKFMSSKFLNSVTESSAFYLKKDHLVAVPYDKSSDELFDLAIHELLHASTLGNSGISTKAKDLLTGSFAGDKFLEENESEYFKDATERYARLKILEIELERLGIKKIGESLTKDQYDKLLENSIDKIFAKDQKDKKFLNKNAMEFLDFLNMEDGKSGGYEILKKMLDEIAMDDTTEDAKGDYIHNDWNYA
jgi:hypothetical protein